MTKSEMLAMIAEREQDFATWFRRAYEFAQKPVAPITSWDDLPPFPKKCNIGHLLTKTTARIPVQFHDRKKEFLLELATFVSGHARILYGDVIRLAFTFGVGGGREREEEPCVGITKQVGGYVAIYWFCFSLEGNLVQVASAYSAYLGADHLPLHSDPNTVERQLSDSVNQVWKRGNYDEYYKPRLFFRQSAKEQAAEDLRWKLSRHPSLQYYFSFADSHEELTALLSRYTSSPDHRNFVERMGDILKQVQGVTEATAFGDDPVVPLTKGDGS